MASEIAYRFISADDHIDLRWLPKDLWTERLPGKLRQRGACCRMFERQQQRAATGHGGVQHQRIGVAFAAISHDVACVSEPASSSGCQRAA